MLEIDDHRPSVYPCGMQRELPPHTSRRCRAGPEGCDRSGLPSLPMAEKCAGLLRSGGPVSPPVLKTFQGAKSGDWPKKNVPDMA